MTTAKLLTLSPAAWSIGIGTRKFGIVANRIGVVPAILEGAKVYTPEQIKQIEAAHSLFTGHGKRINVTKD